MQKYKLSDVAIINPKDKIDDLAISVSFVPMQNVSETGNIDVSEIRQALEVSKGFTSFIDGDVLMAKITPCMENGKGAVAVGLCNGRGFGSTEFFVIRPDRSKVRSEWIYYYTVQKRFRLDCERNMTGSAGQKRVPKAYLENSKIGIPSLAEQDRALNELRQAKRIIALRQRQLAKLDELVKARFVEMFGDPEINPKEWTRQRLDQICENLDSRRVPITSTDRKAGNYPYYGASGIVDYVEDYIFDEDILLISEDGANLVMRSTPIAFSVSGKVWVNNHAHVVRFESKATQKYIEICFALTDISGSITGTAQPKLNQAKLNAMMFCVPPIELQKQFAAFVEQVDKSKSTVQKALDEAQLLFDSLMQKYFG